MTDLAPYEDMWTTGLSKHALVDLGDGSMALFDSELWAPIVIEVDDETLDAIVQNLRNAGARVLTLEEARTPPDS